MESIQAPQGGISEGGSPEQGKPVSMVTVGLAVVPQEVPFPKVRGGTQTPMQVTESRQKSERLHRGVRAPSQPLGLRQRRVIEVPDVDVVGAPRGTQRALERLQKRLMHRPGSSGVDLPGSLGVAGAGTKATQRDAQEKWAAAKKPAGIFST